MVEHVLNQVLSTKFSTREKFQIRKTFVIIWHHFIDWIKNDKSIKVLSLSYFSARHSFDFTYFLLKQFFFSCNKGILCSISRVNYWLQIITSCFDIFLSNNLKVNRFFYIS